MSHSAQIARVAEDLLRGRWNYLRLDPKQSTLPAPWTSFGHHISEWPEAKTHRIIRKAVETIVDVQAVYDTIQVKGTRLYEDALCIAPPWDAALFSYVNRFGNVVALAVEAVERRLGDETEEWPRPADHPIDWPRVRWVLEVVVAVGGRSETEKRAVPTMAPAMAYRVAVYDDLTPGDLSWVALIERYPESRWEIDLGVLMQSLNLANCRNVELVVPERPRSERRRIERHGVVVNELAIRSVGRYQPDRRSSRGDGLVPLTTVRGHPVHYGACCPNHEPRGLLFGKITGRFWVPQHARGDAGVGVHDNDYLIETEEVHS